MPRHRVSLNIPNRCPERWEQGLMGRDSKIWAFKWVREISRCRLWKTYPLGKDKGKEEEKSIFWHSSNDVCKGNKREKLSIMPDTRGPQNQSTLAFSLHRQDKQTKEIQDLDFAVLTENGIFNLGILWRNPLAYKWRKGRGIPYKMLHKKMRKQNVTHIRQPQSRRRP